MSTYVGTMMFIAEATSLDEYHDLLMRALGGDEAAKRIVQASAVTVVKVNTDD